MASEVLMRISRNEVERARLMSGFKGQMDFRAKYSNLLHELLKKLGTEALQLNELLSPPARQKITRNRNGK